MPNDHPTPKPKYDDYLGDGVYVTMAGDKSIRLATFDGITEGNVVYLEPAVYNALVHYVQRKMKAIAELPWHAL